MEVSGNPFRVEVSEEFDQNSPHLSTGKFCAVVYFLGMYVGSFDVTFLDEPKDIEHFLMDHLVSPAFEAAKRKFGVTDED